MAGLGWQELIIVLVIVLIIFGAGRLPDVAKSLGQGVKEFRKEAGADELEGGTVAASTTTSTNNNVRDQTTVIDAPPQKQQMRAEEI
ncbi:MAG: twin-arginine translocase TatA/TatE family subunit [Chloroflexota bacterium]|nr:twin-arginine translocase TatA/TatE family subunit [Chloroflexota bacterium]